MTGFPSMTPRPPQGKRRLPARSGAFTLLEMMVAMTVLVIILVMTLTLVGQVSGVWKRSSGKIDAFQGARIAFDLIVRNLSQATLNTYLGYDNDTTPRYYLRKSDLRFLCGPAGTSGLPGTGGTGSAIFFEAPLGYTATSGQYGGMDSLLNTVGYYVSFIDGPRPLHVRSATPFRYRLMQLLVPVESNTIFTNATNLRWFSDFTASATPIADNVVALLIRPQDPAAVPPDLAPAAYAYDSYDPADASPGGTTDTQRLASAQLPPVLQVTLVAIEEASALRLERGDAPPSAIVAALSGKFAAPARYADDLAALSAAFDEANIRYRIFSGTVPLLEAKWTK